MAFYTTTQNLQVPADNYLDDWDSWHADLCDEDKEPWHAAYECGCILPNFINFKGDPTILERILNTLEYIVNHTDSYKEAWQELHKAFPALLLNGVHGLRIDSEGLEIIRTFEKRARARDEGRFSFFPHEICKTGQQFAKQHAQWIYDVAQELELPEKERYFTALVDQAMKTAAFANKQRLSNVSGAKNQQLPEGKKSIDLEKIERYRQEQKNDLKANYCAHAMQIYQQHGGIVEFITITLRKKACRDLKEAAEALRSTISKTHGGGLALKRGIGAMWAVEDHKSHAPHMHVMIGFPNNEARDWFHKRLRKFYAGETRKLESFVFKYRLPYNAIVIKTPSTAGDIAYLSGYCLKNLGDSFAHLADGRNVSMFGTLYRGGYFEAESGQIVHVPSLTSFANFSSFSSSFHREDTGVNAYSLDNQVHAEPVSAATPGSIHPPAPDTPSAKRFSFKKVTFITNGRVKYGNISTSKSSFSFKKDIPDQEKPKVNAVKRYPYVVPRPASKQYPYAVSRLTPTVAVLNPTAKPLDAKSQSTQQQDLRRTIAAKFLTPTPRRKPFNFFTKKKE